MEADVNMEDERNQPPIYLAAHHGASADIITRQISPHNINIQDVYGNTVLNKALKEKRWELVPVLLQHGADVDVANLRKQTPLHSAISRDAPADIITQLISPYNINMQDEYGNTVLNKALKEKRWELVPVLLQHGADVDKVNHRKQTPLHSAISCGAPADIFTQLIPPHNINMQDEYGNTVLNKALKEKRWELVPVLLQHGADVDVANHRKQTPLHSAICCGAPEDIFTQLIPPHNINMQDEYGNTVLNKALKEKIWALVPVLLQHGADVNVANHQKQTPLHSAISCGAPADIITQLISTHNINMQDKVGDTALHKAVGKERWDLVPILLQHGADPSMVDYPQSQKPLPRSLKALCITTIRSHMPVKSDEAYDGLGLPGKLVDEAKLRPQAEDIVNKGQSE